MPSLVTKLPEERDPVICICFEKQSEAEKTNEDLVNMYSKDRYIVNIWPTDRQCNQINLMLISLDDAKNQRLYRNLSFNHTKLEWWVKYTKNNMYGTKFKFAHIINEFGKDRVVKTFAQKKTF